jgi:LuxR family maltose regulon positive regulatory protein
MRPRERTDPGDLRAPTPGPVLVRSKVVVPTLASEQLSRPRLLAALAADRSRRLTVVVAPAGYGKSRLLAEWCRSTAVVHPTAWLSLDAYDNDPASFWTSLLYALREAYPNRFGPSLAALHRAGDRLTRVVVSTLLNELWASDQETDLVLDDVHVLTNPRCLAAFRFFVEQLPPSCHLVLASRTPPDLGLARLRARGQLRELRAADLSFTPAEALTFLNETHRLGLSADSVAQLQARTEGWAAGLYLAALGLRDHPDPHGFVAAFAGQHRHLVDYFGEEVLEHLADADRDFLMYTASLEQLSGPLCDAVLDTTDATQRLRSLAQQNLFVFPLDDTWQWYRYHPLFRDLLGADLTRRFPDRVASLHRRAAAWYDAAGDAAAAMHHALAAGDAPLIGDLFLAHAQRLISQGRLAAVRAWLAALPETALAARPALALAAAWSAALTGASPAAVTRRIALAEGGRDAEPYFLGEPSLAAAVALARARWVVDDVGAAVLAAEAAVAACGDPQTLAYLLARAALGRALLLAGRPAEAQVALEAALRSPLLGRQVQAASRTLATLALASLALEEAARAGELARRAMQQVEDRGLAGAANLWLVHAVLGQMLVREGKLEEAATVLGAGVEPQLAWLRAWPVLYAAALLPLVALHEAQGLVPEARARLAEAQAAVRGCRDAGILTRVLADAERRVGRQVKPPAGLWEALSEGELRILRLLPTHLSQREIGRELYLSLNTVKSHTRNIYGKLDVSSRSEAVARARAVHLIA